MDSTFQVESISPYQEPQKENAWYLHLLAELVRAVKPGLKTVFVKDRASVEAETLSLHEAAKFSQHDVNWINMVYIF